MPHRGSPDEDGLQVSVIHNHGSKGLAFFNIVRVFVVASFCLISFGYWVREVINRNSISALFFNNGVGVGFLKVLKRVNSLRFLQWLCYVRDYL